MKIMQATRIISLASASGLLLAACTTGEPTDSNVDEAAMRQMEEENENLVCEYERVTGSNMPERICRTREAIEAERANADRGMQSIQRQSSGTSPQ